MNTNLKENNKVNGIIENKLKFDSVSNLSICTNNYPLPEVNVILRGGQNYRYMLVSILEYLLDREATGTMMKTKHTKLYDPNTRSKK